VLAAVRRADELAVDGLRRARDLSVWGPDGIGAKDERIRGLLRKSIPRFDVACVLFGILGYLGGIPAIRDTFSEPFTKAWSGALVTVAVVCLIGLAYPKHAWRLEFFGKCLLIGLLFLYSLAVAIAGVTGGDLGRAAVAVAIFAMTELPQWRLRDIARDRVANKWR
jgi:hypothetical protein